MHFSNELAPVLLDIYDSSGILGTTDVTSRTGIMSVMYENGDSNDYYWLQITNIDQYSRTLTNRLQKNIRYNNRWKPVSWTIKKIE